MKSLPAVALVAAIGLGVVGCKTDQTSASSPSSSDTQAADVPTSAPVDKHQASAAKYVAKISVDAQHLVAVVFLVQATASKVADGTDSVQDLSDVVTEAHSQLNDVRTNLATSGPGFLSHQTAELYDAANTIKNSYGAAIKYVDNQLPSDLSDYRRQLSQGAAEWNDAVTAIWAAAGESSPPTITLPS